MRWTKYENRLFLLRIHWRIDFLSLWNLNFVINHCAKQTNAKKLTNFTSDECIFFYYSTHIRLQYTFIRPIFFYHFCFNLNYFNMEESFTFCAIGSAAGEMLRRKNGKQSNRIKNIININPYVDSMWSIHKPFPRSWHTRMHCATLQWKYERPTSSLLLCLLHDVVHFTFFGKRRRSSTKFKLMLPKTTVFQLCDNGDTCKCVIAETMLIKQCYEIEAASKST